MNKGRREELTQLRFKRRLRDHRITPVEGRNYFAFKTSGAPCSCRVCRDEKYKRAVKHKARLLHEDELPNRPNGGNWNAL